MATPAGVKELTVEQLVPGDLLVDGRIQSHVVRFNEILTEVILPPPKPELRASFEKLTAARRVGLCHGLTGAESAARRQHASKMRGSSLGGSRGNRCANARWRAFLKGKTLSADLGGQAVAIALANAAPLKYNATKIDMAKGLLASGLAKLRASVA